MFEIVHLIVVMVLPEPRTALAAVSPGQVDTQLVTAAIVPPALILVLAPAPVIRVLTVPRLTPEQGNNFLTMIYFNRLLEHLRKLFKEASTNILLQSAVKGIYRLDFMINHSTLLVNIC